MKDLQPRVASGLGFTEGHVLERARSHRALRAAPAAVGPPTPVHRFTVFSRAEWAQLRGNVALSLDAGDLEKLRGLNDNVSLDDVRDIYLPVARLVNIHVVAAQDRFRAADVFLGQPAAKVPFVVGIAGSVAVGKSTTARILQALLAKFPEHSRVALLTTDGFLYPNRVLLGRGLMERKGFPESYDVKALMRTLAQIKAGAPVVRVPLYSHVTYDVLEGEHATIERPDIVLVEGLNVLQTTLGGGRRATSFVSDFFDFSIYIDAETEALRHWYRERFALLRQSAFKDPASYFARYADLSEPEALAYAEHVWNSVNGPNLATNIRPTRNRADLILRKGSDHRAHEIWLKKM